MGFGVRGSKRLGAGKVKVTLMANGQFRVTIPKGLALGYGLFNGSVVDWEITQRGLLLKRSKKGDGVGSEK